MLGLPKRAGWWFRLVDNIFRDAAVLPSGSSAHGRLMTGARTWSLEARLDALPTPPVGDHATSGSGDWVERGARQERYYGDGNGGQRHTGRGSGGRGWLWAGEKATATVGTLICEVQHLEHARSHTTSHGQQASQAGTYLCFPTPRRPSDAEPKDPLSRLRAGALQVWGNGGRTKRLYSLEPALVAMHRPYEPGCVRGCVSTRPGVHGEHYEQRVVNA